MLIHVTHRSLGFTPLQKKWVMFLHPGHRLEAGPGRAEAKSCRRWAGQKETPPCACPWPFCLSEEAHSIARCWPANGSSRETSGRGNGGRAVDDGRWASQGEARLQRGARRAAALSSPHAIFWLALSFCFRHRGGVYSKQAVPSG